MTGSTATLERTDTDALADLEFEVPCDFGVGFDDPANPPCDQVATWKMLNACCGRFSLRCDTHKRFSLWIHSLQNGVTHVACGHKWAPGVPAGERFSVVEPL